jgi:tRNA(Ile)-lysidine synthase
MQLLRNKILRFIRLKQLFSAGDRLIAAVSGGADSVALLDILQNLPGFKVDLIVAHLNHLLRGAESDGDEEFVRQMADRYRLPFEAGRVDVAQLAAEKGLSVEEAGREARYAFFARVIDKYAAVGVATAHHRDDQAETVLMRLLRGSAGSGLAGIRPKSRQNMFVRPLLCTSHGAIEAYLLNRGIIWREDSSNSDCGFLRNRIRHQLLPLLKEYNPEVVERLNTTAEAVAADEELLGELTDEAFDRCTVTSGSDTRFDLDLLLRESGSIRYRLYRYAIRVVKGDLRRISFRHLESLDSLVCSSAPNGHLDLPGGITAVRSYKNLVFSADNPPERLDDFELSISACGSYRLPCGKILHVESVAAVPAGFPQTGKETVFLDPVRIPFPWQVRYFKPGDRIVPLGMNGHKKLKELFIDRKIPLFERYRTPLLLQHAEVVWVCGRQLSELGRLAGNEGPVIRVRMAYTAA